MKSTVGSGLEKLSEYLSDIAKHISNMPAMMRKIQLIVCWFGFTKISEKELTKTK